MQLAFREAARKADVPVRTLERWRAEGLRVQQKGSRLYVDLQHVYAWKRWKALWHPPSMVRRQRAVAAGVRDAVVSPTEFERARREWIAAGGREKEE